MVQVTRSLKISTRIGSTPLGRGRLITTGFRIRKTLIVGTHVLLRQLETAVLTEVIREESTPTRTIPMMVDYNICNHFDVAFMQRVNQLR